MLASCRSIRNGDRPKQKGQLTVRDGAKSATEVTACFRRGRGGRCSIKITSETWKIRREKKRERENTRHHLGIRHSSLPRHSLSTPLQPPPSPLFLFIPSAIAGIPPPPLLFRLGDGCSPPTRCSGRLGSDWGSPVSAGSAAPGRSIS